MCISKRQEKKPTSEGGRYKGREDRRSNVKPMMAIQTWPLQEESSGINPLLHSEKAKSEDEKTSVSFGPF
jgi:hypothetical protein